MSGIGPRKGLRSQKETTGIPEDPTSAREETEETMSEANPDHAKLMLEGLAKLSNEIQDFKTTMRSELASFKTDLKEDITSLRQDMEQKFRESSNALEEQKAGLAEAQARIVELEEWNTEASVSLQSMLTHTRSMQDKMTELEARSRRNNIRIFGLLEESEKDSMVTYLGQLLKRELNLPEDTELHIQRAHRTPPFKPKPGERPRAIVVNFLEFETKEMILKKAWEKKMRVADKPIQFDHDYPTEIVQKRRAYVGIKKVLKERGVRFQTPYTKMRIFWKDGTKSYNNAMDAALDLRARGYDVNLPEESGRGINRFKAATGWERVGGGGATLEERARVKLREYQRPQQD